MSNYKAISRILLKFTLIILSIISFFGCQTLEYWDREQHYTDLGYKKSVAIIDGIYGQGTISVTLDYEFKVDQSLIKQERHLGNNVNYDLVRFYNGAKFEMLYNPENPLKNIILLNKPVFDDSVTFKKTKGEIEFISATRGKGGNFLTFGFLRITCRYWVNKKEYIHRGGISKDLFFPNKDYDEITRKELKQLKRKYKGKTGEIEYDVNNPGASRLIENSIVSNE